MRPCEVPGCDRVFYGKGLCSKHYQGWRKYKHHDPVVQEYPSTEQGRIKFAHCADLLARSGDLELEHLGAQLLARLTTGAA